MINTAAPSTTLRQNAHGIVQHFLKAALNNNGFAHLATSLRLTGKNEKDLTLLASPLNEDGTVELCVGNPNKSGFDDTKSRVDARLLAFASESDLGTLENYANPATPTKDDKEYLAVTESGLETITAEAMYPQLQPAAIAILKLVDALAEIGVEPTEQRNDTTQRARTIRLPSKNH